MTRRPVTALVVAGETSGDEHAARLVAAMRAQAPDVRVLAVGGEALEAAGAEIIHDMSELSVVGITEVLHRLPAVLRVLSSLKRRLREEAIDVFVPVDFPDFNFRLARAAHAAGVPVHAFIAPQVWAWRTGRLREMSRWCSAIAVLFPFEVEIFEQAGIPARYMGHPLLARADEVGRDVRAALDLGAGERLVALFPGSRRSEVERHLPVMLDAAARLAEGGGVSCVLARAVSIDAGFLADVAAASGHPAVPVLEPPARDVARAADLVVTASGTATVEISLAGAPMIVIYKLSRLTWLVARRLVRVDHVAMANLLAGRRLVPELLQDAATPEAIAGEARALLDDAERRAAIAEGYREVRSALEGGVGIDAIARGVLETAARKAAT